MRPESRLSGETLVPPRRRLNLSFTTADDFGSKFSTARSYGGGNKYGVNVL
jgi:hypothetical protein